MNLIETNRKHRWATGAGFFSILLWSTTVALTRSLSEKLGPLTAAVAVCGVSGIFGLASLMFRPGKRRQIGQLPRAYLLGCGALFASYMLFFFLAVGLAGNRQQVLQVGLLNYLWPMLTLLFAVVILGKKACGWLVPGTFLALSGVFLVLTQGEDISWKSVLINIEGNPVPYLFGFAAAVCWALYSTLARKWAGGKTGAVPLFLPATAVILFLATLFVDEPARWSLRSSIETLVSGGITFFAYVFWDTAMRAGNVVLVVAGSYLIPFFSIIVSCLYLSVIPALSLWIGCAVLIAGSLLSWYSISEKGSSAKSVGKN